MKGFVLLVLLFCLGCSRVHHYYLSSMSVYKSFGQRGYTTAGAWSHYKDLEKQHIEELVLDKADVDSIQSLMNRSKQKKHFQTKYGVNVIFCKAQIEGSLAKIIITSEKVIVDLTNMRSFYIYHKEQQDWLKGFILKVKS